MPCSVQDFAATLKESLASLRPVQPCTPKNAAVFVSQGLDSCSYVFLRVDSVRRPLQQPYEGPFKVLSRTRKTFTLDVNGTSQTVAVDIIKPAYLIQHVSSPAATTTTPAIVSSTSTHLLGLHTKKISFLLPRN